MIRIGMLSFWHLHAADYAKLVDEHPETEMVAIWDEDGERGLTEARARGVDFVGDLDELLARDDIDAVIVDCPTSMHRSVIVAAARAGKHIFTEKVLAATRQEATEIAAAAEQAGVVLTVSMWRSDSASTAAMQAVLDSGDLGQLTQLRVRDGHFFALPTSRHPQGMLPEQFYDRAQAQGGALIDLCHPMYLLCLLRGLPESVSARLSFVTNRAVEDNAVVTFSYGDGAIGIAETGYVTAVSPFLIEAHGTNGSALYSEMGIGEMVARRNAPGSANGRRPTWPEGLLRVLDHAMTETRGDWAARPLPDGRALNAFEKWVNHIRSGQTYPENVELALKLSAVIEAAYLSAASGRTVQLDEL